VLCYVAIVLWGESSALSWSLCLWIVGAFGIFGDFPLATTTRASGGAYREAHCARRVATSLCYAVIARALGGEVSFSLTASAIGYSLLPLSISSLLVSAQKITSGFV
jgi:hypothetical protein